MSEPVIVFSASKWLLGEVFDLALGEALARVLRNRGAVARDVLQKQLARAEINIADAADRDEAAAMVFEYIEAARQGAARRNLRMLAEIMAKKLTAPPIYASEFLRWSRLLADLSPEEIITLARLHELYHDDSFDNGHGQPKDYRGLTEKLKQTLVEAGAAKNSLDVSSILGALQRTGLVVYAAGGFGGAWHLPSPRLDELLNLVNFEEVIAEPDR